MNAQLEVIGVLHSTRLGEKSRGELSRVVKELKPELVSLRLRGVKRVGIEELQEKTPSVLLKNPYRRFWKAARLLLEKLGIEPVPLADAPAEQSMRVFHSMLVEARMANLLTLADWQRFVAQIKPKYSRQGNSRAVERLLEEVPRVLPLVSSYSIGDLEEAITFSRSLKLREKAAALGLSHALLGYHHAIDLASAGEAKVSLVKGNTAYAARKGAHFVTQRTRAYSQMKGIAEKFWKLAWEHSAKRA